MKDKSICEFYGESGTSLDLMRKILKEKLWGDGKATSITHLVKMEKILKENEGKILTVYVSLF
jgi:hypothetical protein